MTNKFILWACGLVLVVFLSITSYGVLSGSFNWNEYKTLWSGLLGILLGYVARMIVEKTQ